MLNGEFLVEILDVEFPIEVNEIVLLSRISSVSTGYETYSQLGMVMDASTVKFLALPMQNFELEK